MKLIKRTLLCLGVAAMLPAYAANVQIANSQFDATTLDDNTTSASISGWSNNSGIAGLFNPDNSVFLGEEGHGAHRNTLYMIDNASVSQTFNFRTLQNSTYTLSFDVGQRSNVRTQNYTVKVTAGNETLLEVFNPERASEPGKFATTELSFTNKDAVGEILQLTIETEGTGHLHFDNFELQYDQEFQGRKATIRPIAYGRELDWNNGIYTGCFPSTSLYDEFAYLNYMERDDYRPCSCSRGELVVLSENVNERFVMCVLSSAE